ncbi:MAG: hyaluronan synthase [Acidimicrobiales bacterium]
MAPLFRLTVTLRNEDAVVLRRCVEVLAPQVDRIVVVDDGSRDPSSRQLILDMGSLPNVDVFIFHNNRGKRVGLRVGVEHLLATLNPTYMVTVDSDTIAHPGAVAAAVHELESNPDVGGTTALVRARNWKTNLLTRLQDLRYANAFLWERAAYSQVGSVLCVCGSFTLWRSEVLANSVQRLTDQRFLGRECTYGDDRHLTNLALSDGWRVTLCETAVADTLVPGNVDHFRRQQVRWSKSFFRESLWALKNLPNGWAKTLTMLEISTWAIFSMVLLYSLVIRPLLTRDVFLVQIVLWVSVMSWARSVRFFDSRPEASRFDRGYSFVIAPLYGFLHLLVLLPLRAWAMVTLNDTAWGTRAEVEVSGASEANAVDRVTRTAAAADAEDETGEGSPPLRRASVAPEPRPNQGRSRRFVSNQVAGRSRFRPWTSIFPLAGSHHLHGGQRRTEGAVPGQDLLG